MDIEARSKAKRDQMSGKVCAFTKHSNHRLLLNLKKAFKHVNVVRTRGSTLYILAVLISYEMCFGR